MKSRIVRCRLPIRLAVVLLLAAAALLLTPPQPVAASTCMQLPVCQGALVSGGGCCTLFWKVGTDSTGALCRFRQFGRICER